MAAYILMTAEQADHVRGPALNPIEHQGGAFILGTRVLTDSLHAEFHDYLAALPTMDYSDPNFPPELELPEE